MNREGFTLAEMVVALAIVGLAAALVVPRLWSLAEPARLDAAQMRVADALRVARALCARTGEVVILSYAPRTISVAPRDGEKGPMRFSLPENTQIAAVRIGGRALDPAKEPVAVPLRPRALFLDHEIVLASGEGPSRVLAADGIRATVSLSEEGERP